MFELYKVQVNKMGHVSPFGYKIILVRSILILSLLLTFIFNDVNSLFPTYSFESLNSGILKSMNFFNILGQENILITYVLVKFILIIILTGIYPRISSIIFFWISYSFFSLSPNLDGGDGINSILSLIIAIALLFDNRKSHWQVVNDVDQFNTIFFISNSILILISIQFSVIYLHAFTGKFLVPEWRDGTAFYYFFNGDVFNGGYLKPFINPLISNPVISLFTTWGVLFLEFTLFSMIFVRNTKIRKFIFKFGVLFHFVIIVIFGLGSFFLAMLAGLIFYLLEEEDVKPIISKIKRKFTVKTYFLNSK